MGAKRRSAATRPSSSFVRMALSPGAGTATPDGSEWTSVYVYDGSGRLVTVRTENAAGQLDLQCYEYDSEGRLMRIVARAPDGRDRIAESYEYDATGRKKKTFHVDVTAPSSDTMHFCGVEGTDMRVLGAWRRHADHTPQHARSAYRAALPR